MEACAVKKESAAILDRKASRSAELEVKRAHGGKQAKPCLLSGESESKVNGAHSLGVGGGIRGAQSSEIIPWRMK